MSMLFAVKSGCYTFLFEHFYNNTYISTSVQL